MKKIIQKLHKIPKNTEILLQHVEKLEHEDDFYQIFRSRMLILGVRLITDSRIDLIVDAGDVFMVSSLDYTSIYNYRMRRKLADSCNLHTMSSDDILKLPRCNNWLSVSKELYDFSGQTIVDVPVAEGATSLAVYDDDDLYLCDMYYLA